jgi:hypothetical protein
MESVRETETATEMGTVKETETGTVKETETARGMESVRATERVTATATATVTVMEMEMETGTAREAIEGGLPNRTRRPSRSSWGPCRRRS